MDATTTESSVSTTTTTTTSDATLANNTATTYDEIYKVNQTNSGVAVAGTAATTESTQGSLSTTGVLPSDTTDPMYQHWQRTNARHWTWDMDYPGFDRPVAGSYNTAINGDWQLVMTPDLASAWLPDNSRSLWLRDGSTYLSASESFNTRQNNPGVSGSASINNNMGVSGNTSASVSGLNNNASANTTIANQMNGGIASSSANTTVSANTNTTGTGTVSGSAGVSGSVSSTGTTTGVTGTTDLSATTGVTGTTGTMDVNSINYNASNGNMYQLPKFNLYLDNGSFTGYTGCNGISGRLQVTGTSLRFLNTNPATNIDCLGGFDENILLDMLRRIDSYAYVGDELQLMQGNQVLLRFRKNGQGTSLQ